MHQSNIQKRKESIFRRIQLNGDMVIQDLDPEATYTYLGMEKGDCTDHQKMKNKIQKECKRRIKLVLKSELNARNKIVAISTLAILVVIHSYGVIDWKLDEMQDLDRMTRKQLFMNRILAKKTYINRIYLPYLKSGWGFINLEK